MLYTKWTIARASLVLVLALVGPAKASLWVEETFDYPIFPTNGLHGADGGVGFTGPWEARGDLPLGQPTVNSWQEFRLLADPLSYAGYDAPGRSVGTATTSGSIESQDLRQADRGIVPIDTAEGSTIYLGFTYEKLRPYSWGTGTGLVELLDSSDPTRSMRIRHRRGVSSPVIGPDGQPTGGTAMGVFFEVGLGGTYDPMSEPFSWHTSSTGGLNVPYFLLAKLVFTEEFTVALLHYSTSGEVLPSEDPIWDAWVGIEGQWDLNLDTLRLVAEENNVSGRIGEIRIGSSLQDVLLISDAIPLPGDANSDGSVTDADYTIWADNYGAAGATWGMGDFNGDGEVTDADYTIWADNYGATGGSVPEPVGTALVALGALAGLRRRRRSPGKLARLQAEFARPTSHSEVSR
jgi:MYXO-CTERM domain-containing protein